MMLWWKFKKYISLLLVMLSASLLMLHAAAAPEGLIRVGLYYGSDALASANLANETGSGYQFGFYDLLYQFIPVGSTAREKITICKDSNLYLSGGTFYETPTASSYRLVGAYHIQPAGEFATFEEAAAAAASYPYGFPAWVGGKYVVRFEFYSKPENASATLANYPGAQIVGASSTCYTVVDTGTGDILFEFDAGTAACLAVKPDITGVDKAQTWFKGYRYYGTFQYNRRNGNDITVVNILDADLYVAGVLANEFVCSGGIESLKAGCVAIRTFACSTTKHARLDFDVCTSTDCQVYRGVYSGQDADKVVQAAQATEGQCLYYNGDYIEALFYAANGGATEDSINAWGGDYPYLIGQADPYEDSIEFSSKTWSYQVTPSQVRAMLQKYGYSCGDVVSMEVTQLTASGNVNEVRITDSTGKVITLSRDNVRLLQNISGIRYFSRRFTITANNQPQIPAQPAQTGSVSVYDGKSTTVRDSVFVCTPEGTSQISAPFTVITENGRLTISDQVQSSVNHDPSDGWTISGRGYGHNVGMSQWGAYAMAAQGFTYDRILQFYYPGTILQ